MRVVFRAEKDKDKSTSFGRQDVSSLKVAIRILCKPSLQQKLVSCHKERFKVYPRCRSCGHLQAY